jgi:isopenicillin-N epimerase
MNRRSFLTGLAITGAIGCARQGTPATPGGPASQGGDWDWVRAQFNLSRDWIHMSSFLIASHPKVVRDALERHRRGLDEDPVLYLKSHDDEAPVLDAAAKYMGARTSEIALTDSTTMGLATLYHGFSFRPGDEILTTTHDHYAHHESLRLAAHRGGAIVRKIPLYDRAAGASAPEMVDRIAKAITPRTRAVAITWVHSCTGVVTPVRAIADAVAKANAGRAAEDRAIFCVDGVHGFGVKNVEMADLGCDFFVAGCHKWLFGPRGTGVIWGKAEAWSALQPTIPHFGEEAWDAWSKGVAPPPTNAEMMTPGGYHSFEHRWALAEAFDFHRQIGKAKVEGRIHELNRQCKEGLGSMRHVTVHTPQAQELSAGIICFEVAGLAPAEVVTRLHAKRIHSKLSPYLPTYARLAPAIINSADEVETALRAVRALA